ncbi:carbohydrate porin [Aliiruegeria sabulilitoris]|uniref:carbohydrate porin n=1 Tax=Aliiruegeria sabulilitoris TaxID=1510458 RepID=UPI000831ABF2|nr:carbohydrate porin [Aliiruegeria sabulilitoris]
MDSRRIEGILGAKARQAVPGVLFVSLLLFTMPHNADAQTRDNNPLEAGRVLDDIVPPKSGALIPYGVPQSWFDFKDDVYERTGLRFGVSYQILGQSASATLPGAAYDTALGDWWGFMGKWTLLNRGGDNEGHLVFSMFERGAVGDNAVPATFGLADLGSLAGNVGFTTWDFTVENLYWEQWVNSGQSEGMFRVGNQVVTTLLNPSRFKDERVSFTTGPWAFHPTIPYPTFGFGAGFKWWPNKEDSGLYFAGSVNDMNSNPATRGLDWSTVNGGELFYGAEIGYDWQRSKDDYDHVHLLLFYADERSSRSPDTLPNKAGGGFRIYGEKQWGQWVGFGGYTYNTAQGGGVTGTLAKQNATLGVSYLEPFGIDGEASASLLYMDPIDEIFEGPVRDQYGLEAYWRIRLSNNIWVTPGVHFIFNPALNPKEDFVAVPSLKMRVAF